ncbi:hypothetical protein AbraIFM66950_011389 [Aspergillus brasiliensis]|nr:hypothetical protein AbraIFM66950_011389 [Aspergillus brasiliensis]
MSSSSERGRYICPECRGYCDISDECPTCAAAEPAMAKPEISDSQDDTALKDIPSAESSPQQDNPEVASATAKAPSDPQFPPAPPSPQVPPSPQAPPAPPKKTSKAIKKIKKMDTSSSSNNSTQKERLTPACAPCKKAKRRCPHRTVMPEVEEQGVSQSATKKRKQTAGPKANSKRAKKNDGDVSPDNDTGSEEGQRLKLKFKNVEFTTETGETGESSAPKKRGRPSKAASTDAEVGALSTIEEDDEEEDVPRKRAQAKSYKFPKDAIEAASKLAAYKQLDMQLQSKIEDCDNKWAVVKQTIGEVRYILEKWTELWREGKTPDE